MHPLYHTLAGRACIARLVARAQREGLTVQQFGVTYREERGWGDPSVASLLALWAVGDNLETFAAEREYGNAQLRAALDSGDLRRAPEDPRFPGRERVEAVNDAGRQVIAGVQKASTRLALSESRWHALRAQGHAPY